MNKSGQIQKIKILKRHNFQLDILIDQMYVHKFIVRVDIRNKKRQLIAELLQNLYYIIDKVLKYQQMKYWYVVSIILCFLLCQSSAQSSLTSYYCNVANCQTCSYVNFCGLCNINFILQFNTTNSVPYCQPINCSVFNCQTCYQNNTCSICNANYYVASNGSCMSGNAPTCSSGCLACNSTSCLLCNYGFNLQNGGCFPNNGNYIENCQSSFTPFACQLCNPGYMVAPSYQCIVNPSFTCNSITNCATCSGLSASNITCTYCQLGYQLSEGACHILTCNVQNCMTCNQTLCIECISNYYLANNQCILQIYQCNVSNCLYCKAPNVCSQCVEGYSINLLTQQSNTLGSLCVLITAAVGGTVPVNNCLKFQATIPGTSELTIGCKTCEQNFVNVGGYCVANITQANFTCNIENCVYCIQNNVCGKCGKNYTVYLGSLSICIRDYSPIPNCLLTPLEQSGCYKCADGYTLIDHYLCVLIPIPTIVCNLPGCNYCLSNNTCSQCMIGYSLQNNTCLPSCNVSNCYQCSGNACKTCAYGYYLSNQACVANQNQPGPYCSSTFGNTCAQCTYYTCTQCSPGNTFNTAYNKCCPAPTYNMAYCSQYSTSWSPTNCSVNISCTGCQLGAILTNIYGGECLMLPCNISNCAYCFQSSTCYVCKTGFNLVNGTCSNYTVPANCTTPNCVSCNANNTCTACLQGYLLINGGCFCGTQNCISCQGSFCTQCAFPTFANMAQNSVCLPEIIPNIYCNVSNCLNCMGLGICAQCANGYSLQPNGTCTINKCNPNKNCSLCSSSQDICYLCNPGYIQSSILNSSDCTQIPTNYSCQVSGCTTCQVNNPSVCETCSPFYTKAPAGQCNPIKCLPNCAYCLSSNTCLLCAFGYYFTNTSTCSPKNSTSAACPGALQSQNCIACQNISNTVVCVLCSWGLQPSANLSACVPQTCNVPFCQICAQNGQLSNGLQVCLVCQQGYSLNSYLQCISLSPALSTPNCSGIYNCLFCSSDNYCDYCTLNWNATDGLCLTTKYCSVANCVSCTAPTVCAVCQSNYQLSANICTPLCNIQYCLSCTTPNVCGACEGNLTLNKNTCACQDISFEIVNNSCVCPQNTTLSKNACVECAIENCQLCNSVNLCAACVGNLVVVNNTCECPDDTFILENGYCLCPNLTSLLVDTCISCNIDNCLTCSAPDTCQNCTGNVTLTNNSCLCADTTFIISEGSCICPINTSLLVNTCISCNIQYCLSCSAADVCQTCLSNLTLANNICTCKSQQTLANQTCIQCNLTNCASCTSTNYCGQCNTPFQVIQGTCVCPSNTTFYAQTCVQCFVSNCALCQQPSVCSTCSAGFALLNSSPVCVPCNIYNCISCPVPNFCSSCSHNLVPNAEGSLCITCNIPNCLLCQNNFKCAQCSPGYQLSLNSTVCQSCNIQGCSICSSAQECSSCQFGYSLISNGICILCLSPCATCVSSQFCLTCLFPYSVSATKEGMCFTCNMPNCYNCSSNLNVCTQCVLNYALTSNNTCSYSGVCSQNCEYCLFNQVCQSCIPGFTLNPFNNTDCIQCNAPNCATCSQNDITLCQTCSSGFHLSNGVCYPCPSSNCDTCTPYACTTFKTSTGQISFSYNNTIYPTVCDPGCSMCSNINPAHCINCMSGFTLTNQNLCIGCSFPCLTCLYSSPTNCTSCYANQYLINGNCITCNSSNCLLCEPLDPTQCIACQTYYALIDGSCTVACGPNCLYCLNQSYCLTCQSGYSSNSNGTCLPCLYNCRICSGSVQAICLNCGLGFYLSQNGSCLSCSFNCIACNYQGCVTCGIGFYLNENMTCTLNCFSPCATCLSGGNSTCTSCLLGYYLNSSTNTCTPVLNCPNGTCYLCPIGYISSANTCVQCGSHCARCNLSNTSNCLSCKVGYYLMQNGSCVSCPGGCDTCSSASSCQTCIFGYTLPFQQISNSSKLCVQCKYPCISCLGSPNQCTVCIIGYVLNGWNCQSTFNFGFNVSLSATSLQFYNNYYQFLVDIINCLGYLKTPDIQLVTMISIVTVNNITNVSGILSTSQSSGTNEASNSYYSLQDTLQTSIAGMTILSSSVVVNGGTVLPQSSSKLGVVLGVCIPLALIIIAIIAYLVCVRKSKKLPPQFEHSQKNTTVREEFELNPTVNIQSS